MPKRSINSENLETLDQIATATRKRRLCKDWLFNCGKRYIWNEETNWIKKIKHPDILYASDSGWLVYMFRSTDPNQPLIYTGITNDFVRRAKQHNGLRSAWKKQFTTKKVKLGYLWEPVMILHGFSSEGAAQHIENACKHINMFCRLHNLQTEFSTFRSNDLNKSQHYKLSTLAFLLTRDLDETSERLHILWFKPELRPLLTNVASKITESTAEFSTCFIHA